MAGEMEERRPPDFSSGLATEYAQIERDYRRKVTFLEARPKVEQAFLGVFFFIDAILLLFTLATVGVYVVQGSFADVRLSATTSLNSRFTRAAALSLAPQQLALGSVAVLDTGGGRYDLYATLENPNTHHVVTFDYGFTSDAGEIVLIEGFANPGETVTLTQYAVESAGRPQNARLVLENVAFSLVDRAQVGDIGDYLEKHRDFSIDQTVFLPDAQSTSSATATFSVTNRSSYSYWEPTFLVSLMRGSSIVGLTSVTIPRFMSGETREIQVRFFGTLPATATVVVTPVIPFFDPQAYMSPRGAQLQDVRDIYLLD
ncbi:hypothetical protein KBC55_03125 [Patescibacteria group bacterium]|nr:hypothetical protein [Patescibacteria group bacterium]